MDFEIYSEISNCGFIKELVPNSEFKLILSTSLQGAKKSDLDFMSSTLESHIESLPDISSFEQLVKEVNKFLRKSEFDINTNLLLIATQGKTVHLSHYGDIEVFVYRKGKLSKIAEATKKEKVSLGFISSGEIKENDCLFISHSKNLAKEIQEKIGKLLQEKTLDEAIALLEKSTKLKSEGIIFSGIVSFEETKLEKSINVDESIEKTKPKIPNIKLPPFLKKINLSFLTKIKIPDQIKDIPKRLKLNKIHITKPKINISKPNIKFFSKNKLLLIALIPILLIVFVGSVFYRKERQQQDFETKRFQLLLTDVKNDLEQAKRFVRIDNKVQAKQYLETVYQKTIQIQNNGYFVGDTAQILEEVKVEQEKLDNISYIESAQVLYDNPTGNLSKIEVVDKDIYIVDKNNIYGPLFLSQEQLPNQLEIPNNEIVIDTAPYIANKSLMVLTNANNIYELQSGILEKINFTSKPEGNLVEISTYGNRSIVYFLVPSENEIYGYSQVSGRLQNANTYNNDGVDFSQAISFGIDGNIYTLINNGVIERSYAKRAIDLEIRSGPTIPLNNLGNDSKIFTTENLRHVYILDAPNNRILMYRKDTFENTRRLIYTKLFSSKNYDFQDMWIDNDENDLYFISGSQLLKYPLVSRGNVIPQNVEIER